MSSDKEVLNALEHERHTIEGYEVSNQLPTFIRELFQSLCLLVRVGSTLYLAGRCEKRQEGSSAAQLC